MLEPSAASGGRGSCMLEPSAASGGRGSCVLEPSAASGGRDSCMLESSAASSGRGSCCCSYRTIITECINLSILIAHTTQTEPYVYHVRDTVSLRHGGSETNWIY